MVGKDGSVDLTFEPGKIGLNMDIRTGSVTEVFGDTPARKLGVQLGWVMRCIDGKP